MTQRLLLFITWYLFNGCSSSGGLTTTEDYHLIPFRTIGQKIPLVKASLNGKSAWFIVDTGASITMLNAGEGKYFGFREHNSPDKKTKLSGFSNTVTLSQTSFCWIEIGPLKIGRSIYRSLEMDALFITIEENEKVRIAGVLGSDILAKYGMNVNYETQTLSYRTKKRSQN